MYHFDQEWFLTWCSIPRELNNSPYTSRVGRGLWDSRCQAVKILSHSNSRATTLERCCHLNSPLSVMETI